MAIGRNAIARHLRAIANATVTPTSRAMMGNVSPVFVIDLASSSAPVVRPSAKWALIERSQLRTPKNTSVDVISTPHTVSVEIITASPIRYVDTMRRGEGIGAKGSGGSGEEITNRGVPRCTSG